MKDMSRNLSEDLSRDLSAGVPRMAEKEGRDVWKPSLSHEVVTAWKP